MTKGQKIRQERAEKMKELYRSGKTLYEIGEELGLSWTSVLYWLKKDNIERRRRGGKTDIKRLERVFLLRSKGKTYAQIGKEIGGISRQRVHQLLGKKDINF